MKFFLFTLSLLIVAFGAWARTPVSGFLATQDSQFFLRTDENEIFLIETTSSPSVLSLLVRLSPGDYLLGQGEIQPGTQSLRMTSVDYVGLKKLLGSWTSQRGTFHFKNFTDATFQTVRRNKPVRADLRYSTAPTQNNSWVVFFSEKETTLLSTIFFDGPEIDMNIYQPETGELVQTLRLKRRESK